MINKQGVEKGRSYRSINREMDAARKYQGGKKVK